MERGLLVRAGMRVLAIAACIAVTSTAFAQGVTYAVTNELPAPYGSFGTLTRGSDGFLYGVFAGTAGGAIFKVAPDTSADPVTFTVVHEFTAPEGLNPADALTLAADGRLYGVTAEGGASGFGTLFRLESDNSITVLHAFTATEVGGASGPRSGVVQAADGGFYGVLPAAGQFGLGGIYRVGPAGVFAIVRHFTGGLDGMLPGQKLTRGADGNLYGVTPASLDAAAKNGTIFRYVPSTGAFVVLQRFASTVATSPRGPLTAASDGNLYGTTSDFVANGVQTGVPTVYKIGPATPFTVLRTLAVSEGRRLQSALIEGAGGALFGTAWGGGDAGAGTVFRVTSTGTFTRLVSFPADLSLAAMLWRQPDSGLLGVASQAGTTALFRIGSDGLYSSGRKVVPGAKPARASGRMIEFNGQLIGMAALGGIYGYGALFRSEPNGDVTTLHSFSYADGALPSSLAVGADGNLYGSTTNGGNAACGTLFRMTPEFVVATVHHFPCGLGGGQPGGLLRASDGKLYGVTAASTAAPVPLVFSFDPVAGIRVVRAFAQGEPIAYAMAEGADGRLYATQQNSGAGGFGRVFAMDLTTAAVSVIYEFTGGADGRVPLGVSLGPDNALYGLTFIGANAVTGAAYRLGMDGTFTPLHQFTENGGGHPTFPLTRSVDGYMYGAVSGSPNSIFRLNSAGTFEEIYPFAADQGASGALLATASGVLYGAGGRNTTSFTYALTVPITTALTVDAAGGVYGTTATLSATLTGPLGALEGRTVTFALNGVTVGSAVTNASGIATRAAVSLAGIDAGTYPTGVQASFDGAGAFLPSTAAAALTVTPGSTSTTLGAVPAAVDVLQPVTLTATVAVLAPAPGTAAGNIEFRDGTSVLGIAPINGTAATLTVNGFGPGAHVITAAYVGSGNYASSESAPATLTVRSVSLATFTIAVVSGPTAVGTRATIAAAVVRLAGGVATGSVQFFEVGVGLLGTATLSNGVAVITPLMAAPGRHAIVAIYTGSPSLSPSASSAILLDVYNGAPPAATSLALAATPAATFGQPVTFTATVTAAAGSGTPTGTVLFLVDRTVLGSAAVSTAGGLQTASISTSALSRGVHVVTAVFLPDAGYASSNALPALQIIQ